MQEISPSVITRVATKRGAMGHNILPTTFEIIAFADNLSLSNYVCQPLHLYNCQFYQKRQNLDWLRIDIKLSVVKKRQ